MKKIIIYNFIFLFLFSLFTPAFALFKKKEKPILYLSSYNPKAESNYAPEKEKSVFKTKERIYFSLYYPEGFKSDFIKVQVIKQDDKAHVMGYSRISNKTKRVQNRKEYTDYIFIQEAGKYFIQIFDITNLHRPVVHGGFRVVNE